MSSGSPSTGFNEEKIGCFALGIDEKDLRNVVAHRTFSGVMSGVMYVVTAVVYTL